MSLNSLKKRGDAIEHKLTGLFNKVLRRLQTDERPFINCKVCRSKLARKPTLDKEDGTFAKLACLVCGEPFLLKGEANTQKRLASQLEEINTSIGNITGRGNVPASARTDNA